MQDRLQAQPPVMQTLPAAQFTWLTTVLGAVIDVVVQKAIPGSPSGGHHDAAAMGTILVLVDMSLLDVASG